MPNSEPWRSEAACRGTDIDKFFPVEEDAAGPAKAVCAVCPVRISCLEWAIDTRQEEGVFGGLTNSERRRLRRRRRAAARAGLPEPAIPAA